MFVASFFCGEGLRLFPAHEHAGGLGVVVVEEEAAACVSVCPRGNYKLGSQGVKMQGDCEFCFACIQNCPQKAIRFVRSEDGSFPFGTEVNPDARYRNEHVSLMDIKRSNSQF